MPRDRGACGQVGAGRIESEDCADRFACSACDHTVEGSPTAELDYTSAS